MLWATHMGGFETTHWSIVRAAGSDSTGRSRDALAQLCGTYWEPLYAYLRRQGHRAEDAEDLTQGFFARVLEKGVLDAADPTRGRFRSFLLASLRHYAANERAHAEALKRGGSVPALPLEFDGAERRYLAAVADSVERRVFRHHGGNLGSVAWEGSGWARCCGCNAWSTARSGAGVRAGGPFPDACLDSVGT